MDFQYFRSFIFILLFMILGLLSFSIPNQAQASRTADYINRERLYRQFPLKKGHQFKYRHRVEWTDSEQDQPILLKKWKTEQRVTEVKWTGSSWLFKVNVDVTNHSLKKNPDLEDEIDTGQSIFQPVRDHWLVFRLTGRFLYRMHFDGDTIPEDRQGFEEKLKEKEKKSIPWFVLPPYPEDCDPKTGPEKESCLLKAEVKTGDTTSWKMWYLGQRSPEASSGRIYTFGIEQGNIQILREFEVGRGLVIEREQGPWQRSVRLINLQEETFDPRGDTPVNNQPLSPNSPSDPSEPTSPNQPNSPFSIPEPNQPNHPSRPALSE